mmetsp:Transcript_94339/g.272687  ORF Transcript_94339/g.272687 Transcript_94339/m.272687 type:complete len:345 (+) Transcript_94339:228-1262(+)
MPAGNGILQLGAAFAKLAGATGGYNPLPSLAVRDGQLVHGGALEDLAAGRISQVDEHLHDLVVGGLREPALHPAPILAAQRPDELDLAPRVAELDQPAGGLDPPQQGRPPGAQLIDGPAAQELPPVLVDEVQEDLDQLGVADGPVSLGLPVAVGLDHERVFPLRPPLPEALALAMRPLAPLQPTDSYTSCHEFQLGGLGAKVVQPAGRADPLREHWVDGGQLCHHLGAQQLAAGSAHQFLQDINNICVNGLEDRRCGLAPVLGGCRGRRGRGCGGQPLVFGVAVWRCSAGSPARRCLLLREYPPSRGLLAGPGRGGVGRESPEALEEPPVLLGRRGDKGRRRYS